MYQIYYDEKNGVFEKLEALLQKYDIENFAKTYNDLSPYQLNPYNYAYYLIDSNFRFHGCNCFSVHDYKTITFDKLEKMNY